MSNLAVRVLFAVVAIPVVFFLLWEGDLTRLFFFLFILCVGAWEWARMASSAYAGPDMRLLAPLSTGLIVLAWVLESGKFLGLTPYSGVIGLSVLIVLSVYIAIAYAKVDVEKLFPWLVIQVSAPLYLGLFGGLSIYLLGSGRGLSHSLQFIVVMTTMWVCDTAAYFVGKFLAGRFGLGRHSLAPTLSPKKTWEGAVGGTLFAIGWFFLWTSSGVYPVFDSSPAEAICLGILLALSGQAGDLLMSALKRWTNTKDSSQIFPGHGGVLDRFDSFLLSAPAFVLLLSFISGGR